MWPAPGMTRSSAPGMPFASASAYDSGVSSSLLADDHERRHVDLAEPVAHVVRGQALDGRAQAVRPRCAPSTRNGRRHRRSRPRPAP